MNKRLDLIVTIVTLASVAVAIILYIPEIELSRNQQIGIYFFDLGVVGLLIYDFYARMKSGGKSPSKFLLGHWYEIPAMLPLLLFSFVEEQAFVGVAARSLRLVRLFRLVRLVRLANLFRTIRYLKSSGFAYMIIIATSTVIFGSIAIYAIEGGHPDASIKTYDDAVWFALTTMTISGYGDVYPISIGGKVVAAILIFVGLAIILGFISSLGATLVESRMRKKSGANDESKQTIIDRITQIEKLNKDEIDDLKDDISKLHDNIIKLKDKDHVG